MWDWLPGDAAGSPLDAHIDAKLNLILARIEQLEARLPAAGPRDEADRNAFMALVSILLMLEQPECTAAALTRHAAVNAEFREALLAADITIENGAGEVALWLRQMVGTAIDGYVLTRGRRGRDGRIYCLSVTV